VNVERFKPYFFASWRAKPGFLRHVQIC
jgi:hypothetical protein